MNRTAGYGAGVDADQNPGKVLVDPDSRTVAMEVGTRQGVCNNSPAELVGPENGWRCSVQPTPGRLGNSPRPAERD